MFKVEGIVRLLAGPTWVACALPHHRQLRHPGAYQLADRNRGCFLVEHFVSAGLEEEEVASVD
jgi:hypothetical protein